MSKHYSPWYFIGESFKSLWRNGVMTFASVAVLMSTLVVMGGFSLLVVNINRNLDQLGLQSDIVVILDSEATDDEIAEVSGLLQLLKEKGLSRGTDGAYEITGAREYLAAYAAHLEPALPAAAPDALSLEIETLTHVTKAEALASLKAIDQELYSDINEENNPLPDEFILTYGDAEKVESITTAVWSINSLLESSGDYQIIKTVKGYEQLINSITALKSGVMMIFSWFLAVLGVVSLFIIINTVKLSVYSRRNEIMIMRYVGATRTFITLPFIGEGVIIGLFSGAIAYFIEKYAYRGVMTVLGTSAGDGLMQMISLVPFGEVNTRMLLGFLAIGVVSGVIGSVISLARYSKS